MLKVILVDAANGSQEEVTIRTFIAKFISDERGILGSIGKIVGIAGDVKNLLGGGGTSVPGVSVKKQVELWEKQLPSMVTGAKAAGLHPLVAAGVNPGIASAGGYKIGDDGESLSRLGQSIERAADTGRTKEESMAESMRNALILQKMGLENELLRSQITSINRNMQPHAPGSVTTMDGQGNAPLAPNSVDSGRVDVLNSERTSAMSGSPSSEAAISPANKHFVNADGTLTVWPSELAKQSIEDSLYEYEHMWKNRLFPYINEKFGGVADRFIARRRNWRDARDRTRKYY